MINTGAPSNKPNIKVLEFLQTLVLASNGLFTPQTPFSQSNSQSAELSTLNPETVEARGGNMRKDMALQPQMPTATQLKQETKGRI